MSYTKYGIGSLIIVGVAGIGLWAFTKVRDVVDTVTPDWIDDITLPEDFLEGDVTYAPIDVAGAVGMNTNLYGWRSLESWWNNKDGGLKDHSLYEDYYDKRSAVMRQKQNKYWQSAVSIYNRDKDGFVNVMGESGVRPRFADPDTWDLANYRWWEYEVKFQQLADRKMSEYWDRKDSGTMPDGETVQDLFERINSYGSQYSGWMNPGRFNEKKHNTRHSDRQDAVIGYMKHYIGSAEHPGWTWYDRAEHTNWVEYASTRHKRHVSTPHNIYDNWRDAMVPLYSGAYVREAGPDAYITSPWTTNIDRRRARNEGIGFNW